MAHVRYAVEKHEVYQKNERFKDDSKQKARELESILSAVEDCSTFENFLRVLRETSRAELPHNVAGSLCQNLEKTISSTEWKEGKKGT